MAKFKVSKYGQWKYPGQPTAVPTEDGRITMEGVPYPVMGYVPGQPPIIMQPGGNYQFPGKMVYEIPMAQYGKQIKKSIVSAEELPEDIFPYEGTSALFKDERYNIDRAKELYDEDEFGHLPSIDYETGEWLKAKRYPTSWKEFLQYSLNPEVNKLGFPTENKEGFLKYPNHANGGDISIPDLSRPNWLDKAQKGQQVKYYDDYGKYLKAKKAETDSMADYLRDKERYMSSRNYTASDPFPYDVVVSLADLNEDTYGYRTPGYSPKPKVTPKLDQQAVMQQISKNYPGYSIRFDKNKIFIRQPRTDDDVDNGIFPVWYPLPIQKKKSKPQEFIPTKTPRLEREPIQLVMPQSDRTLMPYNNTLQVLRSIQQEDRNKQGPRIVPAPDFRYGGWLDKYQDGSEVTQMGPELNTVNVSAEKPNAIKRAWNNFERSKYNPLNLFVDDISDINEGSAFDVARQMGMPNYMYNGKRYSTKMDWLTPQEQLEQTGITDDQLHRRGFFEKRLSNNLEPLGYGMGDQSQFDRFWNAAIKNEKDPEKAQRDLGIEDPDTGEIYGKNRTDAYNLYTGLPQKYNTFSISKYKPSRAKDSDVVYYSINDLANNKDFKRHVVEDYKTSKSTIDRIAKEKGWSNDKLDYLKKRYDIQYDRDRINEGLNPGQGLNDNNLEYIFSRVFYGDSDVSKNDKGKLKAFFKDIGETDLANNIDQVIKSSRDLVVDSPYFTKLNDISNDIIGQLGLYDPKTASYNFTDGYAGVMGNYNLSKGVDPETGREYVSYRDKWDIDPVDFGKPFEIYDRIYFDDPDLVVPQQQYGGWLDKYQEGKQVPANLPWINQQGQYQDPNGVGPTVQKAAQAKEEKLKQAVRNSQSMQLPSGAIAPVMGPVEYALMAPIAGASAMRAAPIIGSALNAPIAGVSGATLDLYGANMVSPLFKGATKGITSTYNPSEDDIIRGLLKNGQRDEIERMAKIKPVDMSPSQYPYSTSYPTLSKRDQLDLDSFTRNKWSNPGLFWKRYNMREHGLDYDRPIPIFNDPSMPTDFMSTAAAKGNMYGENQVLVQRSRLLNPDVKAKFFEHQAPAVEGRSSILQKMPKDHGNRITPENYEDFIKTVHGSTDYDLAKSTGKLPGNLGIGSYGKPGMVYSDAPLNNLGKDIINAHEKNHGIFAGTLSKEMSTDLLKPFGTNKVIPHYADKHQADEVLARMAQFKNAAGIGDNQTFTLGHLNLIRKNYANHFLDNGITEMLSKLKPGSSEERQFLKNMNKYAFGIAAPTAIGAAALQKEKDGGWLDNYQDYNYIKYKDLSLSKGTGWLDNYK